MKEVIFASEQAQKLAELNDLTLEPKNGTGKDGSYKISDIRSIIGTGDVTPKAKTAPKAPTPTEKRYVTKKGSAHTGLIEVIDTTTDTMVADFDTQMEADEHAKTLNK